MGALHSPPEDLTSSAITPTKTRIIISRTLQGGRGAWIVPMLIAGLLLLLPIFETNSYWIQQGGLIAVMTLVVTGVNVTFGYAGEVNFSQVFIFCVSAYLTMALATRGMNDVLLLMAIGAIVGAVLGALIAIPASRFGGWPLAIFSFFLVVTIPDFVAIFGKYTGGLNGLFGLPSAKLFGMTLSTSGLYEVSAITCILWIACLRNLMRSRYGVIFHNLRHSAILTQSLGWSVWRLKMSAYALGAAPAGIAGCLFGYLSGIVSPASFDVTLSIGILAACILGGVESFYGAAIGAALLQVLPTESLSVAQYAPVGYGLFLVVAAIFLRRGIGGLGSGASSWLGRKIRRQIDLSIAKQGTRDDPSAIRHSLMIELAERPDNRSEVVVTRVSKSFGGVRALSDVSLVASPGQITGLMGSNGSGKTSLLNIICGYTTADSGQVSMQGRVISGLSPERIGAVGVGRTFQTPSIPSGVSVLDVVSSGGYHANRLSMLTCILRLPKYRTCLRADLHIGRELLELVGLQELAEEEATHLSVGSRRLVEVARALCGKPKILLLDEPASGLSDVEVERLGDLLKVVSQAGVTVLLIEHNYGFVRNVADKVYVLQGGTVLASGSAEDVAQDPKVIEMVLGSSTQVKVAKPMSVDRASRTLAKLRPEMSEFALVADEVVSGYGDIQVLRGVTFAIPVGTIEVILGRNGAGKTTLVNTIAGRIPLQSGELRFQGRDISTVPSFRRARAGIALVQEGKRIFAQRTVAQNLMIGAYSFHTSRKEKENVRDSLLERFPVLRERAKERAGALSGGQQQMLAIAQALTSSPKVLLLDEPSAGLAPAIVDQVFAQIRELASSGLTIVLVEQKAEQAIAIADHVSVVDRGIVVLCGEPQEFEDLEAIRNAYLG